MLSCLSAVIFTLTLGFYFICILQWYSYKLSRIIFHFAKPLWHLYFAILPFLIFSFSLKFNEIFALSCSLIYVVLIAFWYFKLAQNLVFTKRVFRYCGSLFLFSLLCFATQKWYLLSIFVVCIVLASLFISTIYEKFLARHFIKLAKNKLQQHDNLIIILITASYGKTSIKNYLNALLEDDFITQSSPRSVNTLMGLVKDINENLSSKTQIYIAEAGARLKGDIKEIATFLNPQFVIIGQIGTAHLEYFKSIENIKQTKREALLSNNLKLALLHSSANTQNDDKILIYDENIKNINSSLNGLEFDLNLKNSWHRVKIPNLLGEFNAYNVAAAAIMASNIGLDTKNILEKSAKLKNTQHRLQKIPNDKKFIIDDGFNGNFDGMSASYKLVSQFEGRKVLVTPGIMEGEKDINSKLSKIINEIFDIVIITSIVNVNELKSALTKPQVLELKHKNELINVLSQYTKEGDLILFSNDAPQYM